MRLEFRFRIQNSKWYDFWPKVTFFDTVLQRIFVIVFVFLRKHLSIFFRNSVTSIITCQNSERRFGFFKQSLGLMFLRKVNNSPSLSAIVCVCVVCKAVWHTQGSFYRFVILDMERSAVNSEAGYRGKLLQPLFSRPPRRHVRHWTRKSSKRLGTTSSSNLVSNSGGRNSLVLVDLLPTRLWLELLLQYY